MNFYYDAEVLELESRTAMSKSLVLYRGASRPQVLSSETKKRPCIPFAFRDFAVVLYVREDILDMTHTW